MTNFLKACLCASLLALALSAFPSLAGEVVPVLQTKTDTYVNVTLVSQTATHVFVQHSRGVANVKLADLDPTALHSLGISTPNGAGGESLAVSSGGAPVATGNSTNRFASFTASLATSLKDFQNRLAPGVKVPRLNQTAMLTLLVGLVLAYVFFCYCASLVVKKTGNEPGILIWLPVLQVFPMLRAASMSGWWFPAMCVPVVGLVVQVIWCFRISQARGKGVVTAILLILPVTNLFAFLYLAFADGKRRADDAACSPGKSLQTEPLPA